MSLTADEPASVDTRKDNAAPAQETKASREEQIRELEESLSGSVLIGHYTSSDDTPKKLHQERYELKNVRHLGGDRWLFQARIQYGDHDLTIPLTLPVRWAGDTAIIAVDKLPIPGLGIFNARVMIHDNQYAGFWSGGDHGGHLFGDVKKNPQEQHDEDAHGGPTTNGQ